MKLHQDLINIIMKFHHRPSPCCQLIKDFKAELKENDFFFNIFFGCLLENNSGVSQDHKSAYNFASIEDTIEQNAPHLGTWFVFLVLAGWHL